MIPVCCGFSLLQKGGWEEGKIHRAGAVTDAPAPAVPLAAGQQQRAHRNARGIDNPIHIKPNCDAAGKEAAFHRPTKLLESAFKRSAN
jgi:hypothetical protein